MATKKTSDGSELIRLVERGRIDDALIEGRALLERGPDGKQLLRAFDTIPWAALNAEWASHLDSVSYKVGALYFIYEPSVNDPNEASLLALRRTPGRPGKGTSLVAEPQIAGEDYDAEDDEEDEGDLLFSIRLDDALPEDVPEAEWKAEDGIAGTVGHLLHAPAASKGGERQATLLSRMLQVGLLRSARDFGAMVKKERRIALARGYGVIGKTWQMGPCRLL